MDQRLALETIKNAGNFLNINCSLPNGTKMNIRCNIIDEINSNLNNNVHISRKDRLFAKKIRFN